MPFPPPASPVNSFTTRIKRWGRELGFQAVGIASAEPLEGEAHLNAWLERGWHGDMAFMAAHGTKRTRPAELVPGTRSIIAARMDYLPADARPGRSTLDDAQSAYVARYALGRDYHKTLRARLQKLADRIQEEIGPFGYRVFTDSAPVMEVELAARACLGWRGKHTLLLSREAGSWFFLGELYTDLSLPADRPAPAHCGTCRRCIDACPTGAIVEANELDARRCISYLTIEHKGSIPPQFRPLMGNRIYGCDDCQLACPWNRFTRAATEKDFAVRHDLDRVALTTLFAWDEATFRARMAGSAIFRIGHERWLRNIAIALGNAPTTPATVASLHARRDHPSALVREHVTWALARHRQSCDD